MVTHRNPCASFDSLTQKWVTTQTNWAHFVRVVTHFCVNESNDTHRFLCVPAQPLLDNISVTKLLPTQPLPGHIRVTKWLPAQPLSGHISATKFPFLILWLNWRHLTIGLSISTYMCSFVWENILNFLIFERAHVTMTSEKPNTGDGGNLFVIHI